MTGKRKKAVSSYDRQLLSILDQYAADTGATDLDWDAVIDWAESKGLMDPPKYDPRRKIKSDLSRAARKDFIYDEHGDPVRRLHAYTIKNGDRQMTLWGRIEDLTPEKMRVSVQLRRRGYKSGVLQCDRDIQYYNAHHNPGDPIDFDWDFNPDVAENRMPTEYPDAPPPDDEPEPA